MEGGNLKVGSVTPLASCPHGRLNLAANAMDENEFVWPWGMSDQDPDPASRPWVYHPQGFLLAVVQTADNAEMAKVALQEAGFASTHLRIFTGEQLLRDYERFLAQQQAVRRLVGRLTSDTAAVQLFLDYARQGRAFLWVRAPDRQTANRAVRDLASHKVLHLRYYGDDTLEDIHVG